MNDFINYCDEVIREWSKGDGSTKSIPQTERIWFDKTKVSVFLDN